jgi:hypothetical protein
MSTESQGRIEAPKVGYQSNKVTQVRVLCLGDVVHKRYAQIVQVSFSVHAIPKRTAISTIYQDRQEFPSGFVHTVRDVL